MASFNLNVPDELLPGLFVEFNLLNSTGSSHFLTIEEYLQASAIELLRQRCEQFKVGPYYVGVVFPKFNADGTPYIIESNEEFIDEKLEHQNQDASEIVKIVNPVSIKIINQEDLGGIEQFDEHVEEVKEIEIVEKIEEIEVEP